MSAQFAIGCSGGYPRYALPAGAIAGFVIVLLVALICADATVGGSIADEHAAPLQQVGQFTGTYENGLPIYRLPPMQITAVRDPRVAQGTRVQD